MPSVQDLLDALERIAPSRFAFAFDKVGLQVGSPSQPLRKAVVTFDRSFASAEYAASIGADVLLAHHPLIWDPMQTIDTRTVLGKTVTTLLKHDIAFVAAHTNWDSAKGGINDVLAQRLGLEHVEDFGECSEAEFLKMVVLCPPDSTEAVIDAAASAGAGLIGAYNRCAFQSEGTGTFEPQPGAHPTIGEVGMRERVTETRIEMILAAAVQGAVDAAVRAAHPYEEAALDFHMLKGHKDQRMGRIGTIKPIRLDVFASRVDEQLSTRTWTWGDPATMVTKVAVVGGAADDPWRDAQAAGADVFLTGEVRQHVALEASESGFAIMAAGHYATEYPGSVELCERLKREMPEVEWHMFEPRPGQAGRPV